MKIFSPTMNGNRTLAYISCDGASAMVACEPLKTTRPSTTTEIVSRLFITPPALEALPEHVLLSSGSPGSARGRSRRPGFYPSRFQGTKHAQCQALRGPWAGAQPIDGYGIETE